MLSNIESTIGQRNADFALNYLKVESIPVVATDLGGTFARKVCFYPGSGKVELRRIRTTAPALLSREQSFAKKLREEAPEGDIIFF